MEQKVNFDWRSCAALGIVVVGIIFAVRMPDEAVEAAFNHLVDAAAKGIVAAASDAH